MPENSCEVRVPGEHCKYGSRFDVLEKRVSDLERGQDEEAAFRKTYYQDREDRRVRDALLDKQIAGMDKKLDELLQWKAEQLNRPNKLVDGIKDKLVGALVGAIGAGIIVGIVFLIRAIGAA